MIFVGGFFDTFVFTYNIARQEKVPTEYKVVILFTHPNTIHIALHTDQMLGHKYNNR